MVIDHFFSSDLENEKIYQIAHLTNDNRDLSDCNMSVKSLSLIDPLSLLRLQASWATSLKV